ncbi:MAG TPA: ATP-binding protein [Thermoguttaceae bacterium]|nr:ATP-binding protein [Thermoguttaceae bacterium]
MIEQLRLKNFKSFAEEGVIIPFAPVTILVGANASGKSNIFDAIRFLQGIGAEWSVAEIMAGKYEGGRRIAPGLRGGAAEACLMGSSQFTISSIVRRSGLAAVTVPLGEERIAESETNIFEHEITCGIKPTLRVESESLRVKTDGGAARTFDLKEPLKQFPKEHSRLLEVLKDVSADALVKYRVSQLLEYYSNIHFLDVQPSQMKAYVPLSMNVLGEYGENLSAILYRLCMDDDRKSQFLDWLAELCAPEVTDLDFEKTISDKVQVRLKEGQNVDFISAESISDGTLRFMAILAAMYDAPEGTLFVMEEIENGLHPTRIHLLVELLEQFAESKNIQVIATTHSSQVLLGLGEKALRNAVLVARPEGSPGSVVRRLGDLPHFEEVTKKTQIDQLFTAGWLEFSL